MGKELLYICIIWNPKFTDLLMFWKQGQLVEGTQEALFYTEDVRDALASVKTMKEIGLPVVNKMIASLNASLQLLPTLHHPVS